MPFRVDFDNSEGAAVMVPLIMVLLIVPAHAALVI
jgi:hypothetical protein